MPFNYTQGHEDNITQPTWLSSRTLLLLLSTDKSISALLPHIISTSMSFEPSNEQDDDIETAKFLREPRKVEQPDIPFCGCLSVRYYQPYFDVETSDVSSRLSSALFYCKREQNFLAQINDRPDAYGPFWVWVLKNYWLENRIKLTYSYYWKILTCIFSL